ncbi:M1 family metallopeptidase [Dinghuibacter silviterrae]|uniref:Aminopeptidase N n=1 Tax=Dinghuibacter silviterrae TaxID=1539049 RepID=A0A4R8DMU1_9BACT|nr:M1 family metallopeptidase [Dinghuibacter silviterrae]TDW98997.1 aminopeptidase N [Dinghuibacter silviterrae]
MQLMEIPLKKMATGCLLASMAYTAPAWGQAKNDTSWKHEYRASATKINDLVHTKLAVSFDYDKSYMYGKAWITLEPHFYPTDSLTLDAKGMDIRKVAMVEESGNKPLKYTYDSTQLHIGLGKTYMGKERYTIWIDYVSRPNELKPTGSAAITDAKGLYFINPKGTDKKKPTQIWTQGETESNSAWFPTIDKPDQKTTEEIEMTVPSKYVTLSNGLLVNQRKNADGTRTDTWKMDLPHAPYLFFMGVGDYAIIKDSYKGKEVAYYVEKEYAPVARRIFGLTPEMIAFYSKVLGIDFPWAKYDQIVGRDYVSGAMENTTSTLHEEHAQQNARQLTDGNQWEGTIAHELFHQWFGDLVTCESWSNLTVNESFANFSETLWAEHKWGKDAGDEHNYSDMQDYIRSGESDKNLVRFYYQDREDVLDAVTYNKGGRILNMLRYYVGDSAFFQALHLYLTENKFKTGEAHQLRLAFEDITGQDLNWYWNQWYYGSGQPNVTIDYNYDDAAGKVTVHIQQTQAGHAFILPFAIDVYSGNNKERHQVWMRSKDETYTFSYTTHPDLVNVDGDKILLWTKNDKKTAANYIFQYKNAGKYVDRKEAIEYASRHQDDPSVRAFLLTAFHDRYKGLRIDAIDAINPENAEMVTAALPELATIASNDKEPTVRAKALEILAQVKDPSYMPLFDKSVKDSSYSVAGQALEGIYNLDQAKGLALAQQQRSDARGKLSETIAKILLINARPEDFPFIIETYEQLEPGQAKFESTDKFCEFLAQVKDTALFQRGVDDVLKFRNVIPDNENYAFARNMITSKLKSVGTKKRTAGDQAMADYVDKLLAQ